MEEVCADDTGLADVTEVDVPDKTDNLSVSSGSYKTTIGKSFLDTIDEEKPETELNQKLENTKKRKRGMDEKRELKPTGLKVFAGWNGQSIETRGEERWKRELVMENGEKRKVKIPLPEEFDVGKEIRGPFLNNSSRGKHNHGPGNSAIVPRKDGGRGEGGNWVANFTKQGCMGCKSEEGKEVHKGRRGVPVILIIGDEAIPSAVGLTKTPEKEACSWIFKKEHLSLQEVPGIISGYGRKRKILTGRKENLYMDSFYRKAARSWCVAMSI